MCAFARLARTFGAFLLALFVLFPAAALAEKNVGHKLSGTHSLFQVASACGAAGGAFEVADDGGYGCTKQDCDGKGGRCDVGCDKDGNCMGSTPGRLVGGQTMVSILQNGSMIHHDPVVTGGALSDPSNADAAPQRGGPIL